MSVKQRVETDIKEALKARDSQRVGCLRMIKSKLLEREVELRSKNGREYSIEDDEATRVISSYAKQRRDSIESYEKGGREDLAAVERAELAIVAEYLPQQLTADELRQIVTRVVAETGAASAKDMGAVMRGVMAQVGGQADGKQVQAIARELLDG